MRLLVEANRLEAGEITRDVLSLTVALVSAEQGAAVARGGGGRVDLDCLDAGAATGEIVWVGGLVRYEVDWNELERAEKKTYDSCRQSTCV